MSIFNYGCAVETISLVAATINGGAAYMQKKNAEMYKEIAEAKRIELEQFISKDCLLYNYISVKQYERDILRTTEEGKQLLKEISNTNRIMVEKCPNISKP